jgi:hypothetical protein
LKVRSVSLRASGSEAVVAAAHDTYGSAGTGRPSFAGSPVMMLLSPRLLHAFNSRQEFFLLCNADEVLRWASVLEDDDCRNTPNAKLRC